MLIVRRDPERVLDVMLPAFHPIARAAAADDAGADRRHRARGASVKPAQRQRRPTGRHAEPTATEEPAEEGAISEEEGRELLQSIVDFTETVVREVMTPRPDIVAIRADATLHGSAGAVPRGAVLAHARLSRQPRQHHRHRVRQGSGGAAAGRRAADDDADAVGVFRAGEQARRRSC